MTSRLELPPPAIRIDVRRIRDNEVTRLEGAAGLAIMLSEKPDPESDLRTLSSGVLALRCYSTLELAVCLASLMAGVRDLSPLALEQAFKLAPFLSGKNPEFVRELPPEDSRP